MTDPEVSNALIQGFEFLCQQCAIIAMLPLEDWRDALSKAETIGAVLDPTLYRAYLHSEKAEFIKELIAAAIPVKQLVTKMQETVKTNGGNVK